MLAVFYLLIEGAVTIITIMVFIKIMSLIFNENGEKK